MTATKLGAPDVGIKNPSLYLYGARQLKWVECAFDTPVDDDDVEIALAYTGICGSDLHNYANGRNGFFKIFSGNQCDNVLWSILKSSMFGGSVWIIEVPPGGYAIGHESSGYVTALGANASRHLAVGDRVTLEPAVPCEKCVTCVSGHTNVCPTNSCVGKQLPGTFAKKTRHPARYVYKLPPTVSDVEGALVEPLSVGLHAFTRSRADASSNLLICGAGPIGLLTLMAARASGVTKVTMTDINPERLAKATEAGASRVHLIERGDTPADVATALGAGPGGVFDAAVDASGTEHAVNTAIHALKSGTALAITGIGRPQAKIEILEAFKKEITIRGAWRCKNNMAQSIDLIAQRKVKVESLVSHRFDHLGECQEAFETLFKQDEFVGKVLVKIE